MTSNRDLKTEMTPRQKAMAYIANRCDGVDQQMITTLMGISNSGRVAEAIIAVEYAIEHTLEVYKLAKKKNGE